MAAYRLLGIEPRARETVATFATDAAMLPVGESDIELIAPTGNPHLERFLDRRGPGLHHIALEVDHLDAAVQELTAAGAELVADTSERGIEGRRVAFVHPRTTGGVLIELVERAQD